MEINELSWIEITTKIEEYSPLLGMDLAEQAKKYNIYILRYLNPDDTYRLSSQSPVPARVDEMWKGDKFKAGWEITFCGLAKNVNKFIDSLKETLLVRG